MTPPSASAELQLVVVQSDIDASSPERSRERIEDMLGRVSVPAQSLVVLPELCSVGLAPLAAGVDVRTSAASLFEGDVAFFRKLSANLGAFVLGASVEPSALGRRNAAVLMDPRGELSCTYGKIHLMSQIGEGQAFTAGAGLLVVPIGCMRTLISVCYDLSFPELYRAGHEGGGYDLITVQANWPAPRHAHWEALLVARAIENQAWVLGVNRVGAQVMPFGSLSYRGGSLLVNPRGEVVARAGDGACVLSARVDLDAVRLARRQFDVLRDRRLRVVWIEGASTRPQNQEVSS